MIRSPKYLGVEACLVSRLCEFGERDAGPISFSGWRRISELLPGDRSVRQMPSLSEVHKAIVSGYYLTRDTK